ncbi:periphilin-1-like isoform X1 [Myxocyprinus asiaticus]|uniref:periphilin-1-like isoform X1 n=1 Tax=Myxocyprinus asiaticus TaxID=70543 RepID=UPI0022223671|nr:periphilin-1-like isoform X1 [Myxocyprinus asiaticus]
MDTRTDGGKTKEKRPIHRMRSPSRYTRPYRPRFGGKYFRPRFFRTVDERSLRRPGFVLRYQRYHAGQHSRLQRSREHSPKLLLKHRASSSSSQQSNRDKNSSTAAREHSEHNSTDVPQSSSADRPSLSFTVSQEGQARDALPSLTRAAARNRAIQRKREQIEEVYRQDCDTFGMVVKMLVAKDPSLERPIQLSLRENLRDIGLRCVEAMEDFIQEYDSREPDNPSTSKVHSI